MKKLSRRLHTSKICGGNPLHKPTSKVPTQHHYTYPALLVSVVYSCLLLISSTTAFQVIDSSASISTAASSDSASSGATCFGGLQTFEKISMSSFESPQQQAPSSFGGGILIQQDDQALTSECVNLCKSQSNCLSFVIDYNKFECKSYATTQLELQQELLAKYQAARAASSSNVSSSSSSSSETFQESPSELNIQHLLPSTSSNYFEKICFDGFESRELFNDICGQGRLWTIERVVDSFLDGFVEKEVTNVNNKDECSKLCIFERQFVCRSADYDQNSRLCRLSKEDRRTQPQAMRKLAQSNRHYLENQCAAPGPSSCVYETKKNLGIISMDALKFAQTLQDCQMKCNQEATFNCRSYSYHQQRCFLSGDDGFSLNSNLIKLPMKQGWLFGEKKCLVELCTKGIFTYEKISGHVLRSSQSTPIDLMAHSGSSVRLSAIEYTSMDDLREVLKETNQSRLMQLLPQQEQQAASSPASSSNIVSTMMRMAANSNPLVPADPMHESASNSRRQKSPNGSSNNLAITGHCRQSCDLAHLNCPAFTIDYKNNRCQRLDRNSQGRDNELVAQEGFSYYEKICLRVPEIMSMCQDKYWIFERVIGYELAPRFYERVLKFVLSRRDCEEYCLEEKQFQCRSALYNDEVFECKLSSVDRRLVQLEGGYFRNFNPKISYLENQCIRDQSHERKQQCSYEKARDEPAYPTYTELIEVVNPSPLRPTTSTTTTANEPQLDSSGLIPRRQMQGSAYCEQLCNDNTRFQCHSFGYYASTAQCFLSGDDTVSVGELSSSLSTGFTYYEKKCKLATSQDSNHTSFIETGDLPLKPPTPSYGGDEASSFPERLNPYFRPPDLNPTRPGSNTNISIHIDQRLNMFHTRPTPPAHHTYDGSLNDSSHYSSSLEPNQYKCGIGHSFVYQRVSGFEPIGGYLTLLVVNHEHPGIVAECAELCKRAYECRAFVVDYNSNQCYAMLENSSVGLLSLRQTLGKDYFEGFCVADHLLLSGVSCRNRTWIVDKILDQTVLGVQHQKLIPDSDRAQCRQACLEERLFWCKSALFDGATNDCKLYSVDRESMPQMRLLFTKGVDFYENQCQISSTTCPYDPIERDVTIVTQTKSLQARSTFDCELACNSEVSFNCRSYTFMDQQPGLPNVCLLSSDSRSTSQKGSLREHHHTLYAERNCYFRRPRYPTQPVNSYSSSSSGLSTNTAVDPYSAAAPPTGAGEYSNPPRLSSSSEVEQDAATTLGTTCKPHQYTFERTFGYDFKEAPRERVSVNAAGVGVAIGCQQECLLMGHRCQSFVVDYSLPYQSCYLIQSQAGANRRQLVKAANSAYFEKVCLAAGRAAPPEVEHQTPGQEVQSDDIAPSYSSEPWTPQNLASAAYQMLQPERAACSKLWQFDRFIGHNFTLQADRVYHNVLGKADCEAYCLMEAQFGCRAATYDYSARICRLFKSTRRSFMSHFIDLNQVGLLGSASEPSMVIVSSSTASSASELISHQKTHQHHSSADSQSMATSTAATTTSSAPKRTQQQQQPAARLTRAESTNQPPEIDYLENNCVPEPASCQYRPLYDLFSPYIDKMSPALSLSDCQRQCDLERLFSCKSINYDPASRNCMLINEDLISLERGPRQHLVDRKNSIYSEKGNCEMISVQCKPQEMLVLINFDAPFRGRIMAKGNPEQCFLLGEGQTSLQFPIVFGPKCNSRQEGYNTFVNELVIQQHPVVMMDNDRSVRVMCAFDAPDQIITLKSTSSRDNSTQLVGIDVSDTSRQRHDKQHQFTGPAVVSNKAPPPNVQLKVLDSSGREVTTSSIGDDLILKIQMQLEGEYSALGTFASQLYATSPNGDRLLLIDKAGCPVDPQVFPALELDPADGRSLLSRFKTFKFPSSTQVIYEVNVKFCIGPCRPAVCNSAASASVPQRATRNTKSYGKRRKRRDVLLQEGGRLAVLQSQPAASQLVVDSLVSSKSTLMKPGRAFQFVRELLALPKSNTQQEPSNSVDPNSFDPIDSTTTYVTSTTPESAPDYSAPQENPGNRYDPPEVPSNTALVNEFTVVSSTPSASETQPETDNASNEAMQLYQKSILMHVDQKVVPNFGEPSIQHSMTPYGRFPAGHQAPAPHQHHYQQPKFPHQHQYEESLTSNYPANHHPPQPDPNQITSHDPTTIERPDEATIHEHTLNDEAAHSESTMSQPSTESQPGPHSDTTNNHNQFSSTSNQTPSKPGEDESSTQAQDKNTAPVRFSILVGENQPSGSATDSWQPVASNNPQHAQQELLNNSTTSSTSASIDGLDHVVVPGRGGQLDQQTMSTDSASKNTIGTAFAQMSTNGQQQSFGVGKFHLPQSSSSPFGDSSSSSHLTGDTSKRSAVYEQTFDALPSNSIAAEVKLNQELAQVIGGQKSSRTPDCITGTTDGHLNGRMWSLITAGTLVIVLNICVVVTVIFLYLRKAHFRHQHDIMRDTSDSSMNGQQRRSRWPSVLLKSKNNLGTTSINTHEHFFCKLNSDSGSITGAGQARRLVGDPLNSWQNMHTTNSTTSSKASPLSLGSSVRVHQQPRPQPRLFDPDSSLNRSNLYAKGHKSILEVHSFENSLQRDKPPSSYLGANLGHPDM